MADIAGSEISVLRWAGVTDLVFRKRRLQGRKELIEAGAITYGNVVDLVARPIIRSCSKQVRLHGVGNITEIAAGFAVAVDEQLASP